MCTVRVLLNRVDREAVCQDELLQRSNASYFWLIRSRLGRGENEPWR